MIKFNKNKGFFITGSTAKYCADVAPERIQFRQYSIILQYICKIQYVQIQTEKWSGKITQQVKVLAAKPDDLKSTPGPP